MSDTTTQIEPGIPSAPPVMGQAPTVEPVLPAAPAPVQSTNAPENATPSQQSVPQGPPPLRVAYEAISIHNLAFLLVQAGLGATPQGRSEAASMIAADMGRLPHTEVSMQRKLALLIDLILMG
jgi:hypothetical protein